MTPLRARLFGGFELSDSNGAELKLSTRKTRALIAFLIVEADRWHTRERLADLLWSDRQQAQARHSLTQALSTIRKLEETAGEQLIESDSERVRLLAQSVEADVLSFREAGRSDASAAAECYTGPLLDGFVAPDESFEEWLLAERASYHGAACSALRSLVEQEEASNELPAAIAAVERLLALDPLGESEHRRLMRLYADNGNRSEAIRQYERCEQLLRDELGVEPSHETTALLETVRSQHAPITSRQVARSPSVEVAQDVSSRTPLDRPSIAVLPFENLSRDPEQEYFADGMAEDLITALSRFRSLIVIPRNSTFSFKGQVPDLQQVARELAARYVLEGSVRRAGNRIRISAQLIDTSTGDHLWADRFDRSLDDIFVVQDEVADGIISAIAPEIDKVERKRAQRAPPESLDAWSLYQRGLTSYHATTRDGLQSAIGSFDQAIELDPNFAAAYALAADA
jgi:TolB-like protein